MERARYTARPATTAGPPDRFPHCEKIVGGTILWRAQRLQGYLVDVTPGRVLGPRNNAGAGRPFGKETS